MPKKPVKPPRRERRPSRRLRESLGEELLETSANRFGFTASQSMRREQNPANVMQRLGIRNMDVQDYVPSPADKPHLCAVKPVHLLDGGLGLYASRDIAPSTCIGEYTGKEFKQDLFKDYTRRNPEANQDYAMKVGRRVIDASSSGNFTRYANFSDSQPNLEFQESERGGKKIALVVTTKPIKRGQQFLVDYNQYDERASKDYCFLNPQDNWQSTAEFYQSHNREYTKLSQRQLGNISPEILEHLSLDEGEELLTGRVGLSVLNCKIPRSNPASINLPYLKINAQDEILDAR